MILVIEAEFKPTTLTICSIGGDIGGRNELIDIIRYYTIEPILVHTVFPSYIATFLVLGNCICADITQ